MSKIWEKIDDTPGLQMQLFGTPVISERMLEKVLMWFNIISGISTVVLLSVERLPTYNYGLIT